MAMVTCGGCQAEMTSEAQACPKCGRIRPAQPTVGQQFASVLRFTVLFVVASFLTAPVSMGVTLGLGPIVSVVAGAVAIAGLFFKRSGEEKRRAKANRYLWIGVPALVGSFVGLSIRSDREEEKRRTAALEASLRLEQEERARSREEQEKNKQAILRKFAANKATLQQILEGAKTDLSQNRSPREALVALDKALEPVLQAEPDNVAALALQVETRKLRGVVEDQDRAETERRKVEADKLRAEAEAVEAAKRQAEAAAQVEADRLKAAEDARAAKQRAEEEARVNAAATKRAQEEARQAAIAAARVADEFAAAMDGFATRYRSAPNEIKKSLIFKEARAYDTQVFERIGNSISSWTGVVRGLSTNKGGSELRLSIGLKSKVASIGFRQGYGLLEDGISQDNPVYAQAAELVEGGCVVFSGEVIPREKSSSEAGAMRAPEYSIKFTQLSPCKRK